MTHRSQSDDRREMGVGKPSSVPYSDRPAQLKVGVALDRWEPIANALGALDPKTPAQKDALAAAKANLSLMEQTRLLMSLQLSSPVAWSLVTSVILWSMFLFCGFGFSRGPIRQLSSRWRSARFRWRARCSWSSI